MAFEFHAQGVKLILGVRKDEVMKSCLMQLVINALATDEKIRHTVPGFDWKIFIACVPAEWTVPIIDADLRDEREHESFHRAEIEERVCHRG